MNLLVLEGQLFHVDGKKFIEIEKGQKTFRLPIECEEDFDDDYWVRFVGRLRGVFDNSTQRVRKVHYGVGKLEYSYVSYFDHFECGRARVVSVGEVRTTPLTMRRVCDFVISDEDGNFINCIAFGGTAERLQKAYRKDIEVREAYFQSRPYIKNGEEMIAYELVVQSLAVLEESYGRKNYKRLAAN